MIQTSKPLMLEAYERGEGASGRYYNANGVEKIHLCRDRSNGQIYGAVHYTDAQGHTREIEITKESAKALLTDSAPMPECLDVNA